MQHLWILIVLYSFSNRESTAFFNPYSITDIWPVCSFLNRLKIYQKL